MSPFKPVPPITPFTDPIASDTINVNLHIGQDAEVIGITNTEYDITGMTNASKTVILEENALIANIKKALSKLSQ